MDERRIRELYIRIQVVHKHLSQLDAHRAEIGGKVEELSAMMQAVDEAKDLKDGDELLIPLTNGIFIPVTASALSRLHLNVGAQTMIAKTPGETLAMLSKQQRELAAYDEKIQRQQEQLRSELEKLEAEASEEVADV